MRKPFIFATGGTGGHVNPAVALSESLATPVVFAGHKIASNPHLLKGLHRVVSIPSAPITSFFAPFTILWGIIRAILLLRREKPKAVVGFGSYHSFPVVCAAYILGVPLILLEPNAVLGKVNRLFAKKAKYLLSPFNSIEGAVQVAVPTKVTGRASKREALTRYQLKEDLPTVLIFGGSLGAKIFETLPLKQGIQVIHFVGRRGNVPDVQARYEKNGIPSFVSEYEEEMDYAWAACDVCVCRSGAVTIAEHVETETPCLFIPFPKAADNHQLRNAQEIAKVVNGSLCLQEKNLHDFPVYLETLLQNKEHYAQALADGKKQQKKVEQILERYHFLGIGGIGMSAVARLLHKQGYVVQGSDQKETSLTTELQKEGISVVYGENEDHLPPYAHVVYSSAIKEEHAERAKAIREVYPLAHRSVILDEALRNKKNLVVTGTHGKTSTTALLAHILQKSGKEPIAVLGGIARNYGTNLLYGNGAYAAIEADESDGSFLQYTCDSSIITNIEPEHLDFYKTEERLIDAFQRFIARVKHTLIWCYDDAILKKLQPHGISYGFHPDADARIVDCRVHKEGTTFSLTLPEGSLETYTIPQYGNHAVSNAAGVITLLYALHVEWDKNVLAKYKGVARRLEYKGRAYEVDVYDDYAHHPTEVLATLLAVRQIAGKRRVVSVFQPHKFSRFKQNLSDFAKSLERSDVVIVTDIYAAGETNVEKIHPRDLLQLLKHRAKYIPRAELETVLVKEVQKDDVLLFLGAGDITTASDTMVKSV